MSSISSSSTSSNPTKHQRKFSFNNILSRRPSPPIKPPAPTKMNFIFNKASSRIKTPGDLVKGLKELIIKLDGLPSSESGSGFELRKKVQEEISKNLSMMKTMLYGEGDQPPDSTTLSHLAQEIYGSSLLSHLLTSLVKFEFEARKDVSQIFNSLLRRQIGTRLPTVEYLSSNQDVVFKALKGYEVPETALNTGIILREMLRYEPIGRILLYSDELYSFFAYIEQTTFGIACDAMANFKEVLTRHKPMVAEYLDKNYDKFFSNYTHLIKSTNYVTKRQSLKLLGEILLDRANFNVMTRYIASEENLKDMMNLLRDKSKNIQFEAFHVFKVFVANPKKPAQIEAILRRNKERLITFLQNFHNDKEDDQFNDEKSFLLTQIQRL